MMWLYNIVMWLWDFLLAKHKKLQFTPHLGKRIAAWIGSKLDINDAY